MKWSRTKWYLCGMLCILTLTQHIFLLLDELYVNGTSICKFQTNSSLPHNNFIVVITRMMTNFLNDWILRADMVWNNCFITWKNGVGFYLHFVHVKCAVLLFFFYNFLSRAEIFTLCRPNTLNKLVVWTVYLWKNTIYMNQVYFS